MMTWEMRFKLLMFFTEAMIGYTFCCVLTNGNFVISYLDYDNSNYGTFVIYEGSGAHLSKDLQVDGEAYLNSGLSIGGTPYSTTVPPSYGLIVKGKVGIGTDKPGEKLEVVGTAKIGADSTLQW